MIAYYLIQSIMTFNITDIKIAHKIHVVQSISWLGMRHGAMKTNDMMTVHTNDTLTTLLCAIKIHDTNYFDSVTILTGAKQNSERYMQYVVKL